MDGLLFRDPSGEVLPLEVVGWDELDLREITKGGDAAPPGARWITVHPHGSDGPGRPVLIREVKGSHGVFHIVGGASGKLNGLRLQNVKSPEEYKAAAKDRAKELKAKRKEAEKSLTPEERESRKLDKQAAHSAVKDAEKRLIEATLKAKGLDPAQAELDTDNNLARVKHHRALLSEAMKSAAQAEKSLVLDAQARMEAGLETVGGDQQLDADTVLTTKDVEAGAGYQRGLKQKAEEAGLTQQGLADTAAELREQAAKNRVEAGDFTDYHTKLGGGDPVLGIQIVGARMGELNRQAHQQAKAAQGHATQNTREAMKAAATDNQALAEILAARKALREALKGAKQGKPPIFAKAFQAHLEELTDGAIQDIEDQLRTERFQGFLDEVEKSFPEPTSTIDPDHIPEDGLHASRHTGAFDALHEIGLGVMGQGAISREAVEVLGPDGAATILARALKSGYTHEEQAEILEALEGVHQDEQEKDLPQAMAYASQLRDEAAKVGEELAENAKDLAIAAEMQRNKVALLKEARRTVGAMLGRMEARAALIAAMQGAPSDRLTVPIGKNRETAIQAAYALGLENGDYHLDQDRGEVLLHLTGQGQNRLIRPVDQAALAERETAMAIKRGDLDEDGWIPKGFTRRTALRSDDPLLEPPMFRQPFQVAPDATPEQLQESIEDYIGARYADGDRATDILQSLNNASRLDSVPEPLWETYQEKVRQALPLREAVLDAEGNQAFDVDEDSDEQLPRTRAAKAETIDRAAQAMAERYFERKGLRGDLAFYRQGIDPDSDAFRESAHRALAKNPRASAAFTPVGELTSDQQRDLREHFYESLAQQSAKKETRAQNNEAAAKDAAGPEPPEYELDMFGEQSHTPEWLEWHERVQTNLAAEQGQAEGAAPAEDPETPWARFVETMGGLKDAQRAVQDHMASEFLGNFAESYQNATGQKFKQGQAKVHMADKFIKATGTAEQKAQARAERQAEVEANRGRGPGGKFKEGSINARIEEKRQRGATAEAEAGGLFDLGDFTQAPAPAPEEAQKPFALAPGYRLSFGPRLEAQLRQALPAAAAMMQGQKKAVALKSNLNMSGRFIAQQRGIKAITHLHRIGLFYGAGSGKTSVVQGAHAELHAAGKVQKAIYAVPSAVQAQFGAEAAMFIDPSSGLHIHAKPGETFEERIRTYQAPDIHGVVVTHQALRDDTLKVLGQHVGKEGEALKAWVHGAKRQELAQAVKDAWGKASVNYQALFLDEGHNALNRAGKEDSTLAKIIDAVGDTSTYYAGATGDPIKNDPSEAYDWLTKIDPRRYPPEGRDEFMRRFGGNTAATRRSLKAELARYYFAERVDPGVQAHHEIVKAKVTPEQQQTLAALDANMNRLRTARTPEEVLERAKAFAPEAFEGKDGMEPQAIADSVKKAVGTFKEAAYNRILNCDPKGGKVQETVAQAKASIADGRPPIIFARNLAAVEAIHQAMEAAGIHVTTLTGKHSAAEKAERIKTFQPTNWNHPDPAQRAKPGAEAIVMSDAGATGINLQRGADVIHHDIPQTHMTHSQRTARAHRLGQTRDVRVKTIAADHAFDQNNLQRLKRKEALAGIFKSPEGFLDDSGIAERMRALRQRRLSTQTTAA